VAIYSIVYSFLIAASTALVTGAMAMAIATFKIGTRRTIFSFYLFIVCYLVGLFLLDKVEFFKLHWTDAGGVAHVSQTSWFTSLHPFLALQVIFNDKHYMPPNLADLPARYQAWPWGWYWSSPASFYITSMFTLSFALIMPSIVLLRKLAQSTTTLRSWALQRLHLSTGDRTRKPRIVWNNPIAWREAKTKASAARASIIRYGFIVAGLLGAIVLVWMHSSDGSPRLYINNSYDATHNTLSLLGDAHEDLSVRPDIAIKIGERDGTMEDLSGEYEVKDFMKGPDNGISKIDLKEYPRQLSSPQTRQWLLGITIIEFSVILLIISNAAASTVTREKEDGTLDLLLSTPITSRYYIWGKLRGLVSFVLPLIAVPAFSALIFVAHDLTRWLVEGDTKFQWIVFPEALAMMPAMLIIVCAFAAILGMQMSLRCRTTVRAVMSSVGIIVGACALMGWCGWGILTARGTPSTFAVGAGTFSPFTLLTLLIDPYDYGGNAYQATSQDYDPTGARTVSFVVCVLAMAVYALGVWSMYKSMVKNFDMTIRRQSR
jgi:ABC-type transport system involved in multi-copper enzyme maturation permease subunit